MVNLTHLMKPKPNSTIGPLHFEDLEPHRFEDLVRQLIYDFREWSSLEAIGRTGSDQGMDSRGFEIVRDADEQPSELEQDDEQSAVSQSRSWIIQCKRYAAFTPSQVKAVVEEIVLDPKEKPYGLIIAVPANVSLATRRAFALAARNHGFEEFELWGKGELEDKLFWPKYDHLLFAYFGISLQVRRRSDKTRQRSLLTLKRQLSRALGDVKGEHFTDVLIRHPDSEGYPFVHDRSEFKKTRSWWYYKFSQHWPPDKVHFEVRCLPAFINPATKEWDVISDFDLYEGRHPMVWDLELEHGDLDWQAEREEDARERERFMKFFEELPEENQGHLVILGSIPYDRILAVDELGDSVNDGPHLVVEWNSHGSFFDEPNLMPVIRRYGNHFPQTFLASPELRIKYFPEKYPKLSKAQYDRVVNDRRTKAKLKLKEIGLD